MRPEKASTVPLSWPLVQALFLLLALASSCARTRAVDTSAPPPGARSADVAFMQAMIGHHAQALAMTRLVASRSTATDVRTLADRIQRSQRDEIALMTSWLRARGQPVPDTAHIATGGHPMEQHAPGMLTAEQLDTLRGARGPEFDRLFLAYMIQHHRGALEMVRQLLASPGGGQDPEAYRFASDVDADQRAEIGRMQRMIAARTPPESRPRPH